MYTDLKGNTIRMMSHVEFEQAAIRATFKELSTAVDPRSGKERFGKLFDLKLVDENGLVTALKIIMDKSDVRSAAERSQHIKDIFRILDKNLGKKLSAK